MGTWGAGNLDSDQAADYFQQSIILPLFAPVREYFTRKISEEPELSEDEFYGSVEDRKFDSGEEKIMPTLDALITLCERFNGQLAVRPETAALWKEKHLQLYDQVIDGWGPKSHYQIERRQVITATFDRLIAVLQAWDAVDLIGEPLRIKVFSLQNGFSEAVRVEFESDFGAGRGIWEKGIVQEGKVYFVYPDIREQLQWKEDITRSTEDRIAIEVRDDHVYLRARVDRINAAKIKLWLGTTWFYVSVEAHEAHAGDFLTVRTKDLWLYDDLYLMGR